MTKPTATPGVARAAAPARPSGLTGASGASAAMSEDVLRSAPSFGNGMYEVARKEVLQYFRTKRLLIIGPIFLLAVVLVTIVLPVAVGEEGRRELLQELGADDAANAVMTLFLAGFLFLSGYFYVALLPLVLTADAVCSEWANRSIFLVLSKPVSRSAFVLGKFAGSAITVVAVVVGVLVVDYLVVNALVGASSPQGWLRFLGALGILACGVLAYTALALLLSCLTRSAVTANILAISMWIIVLPLVGNLAYIVAAFRQDERFFEAIGNGEAAWSSYLDPGAVMKSATGLLSDVEGGFFGSLFGASAIDPIPAVFTLLAHTALYLGLALLMVNRRNFE